MLQYGKLSNKNEIYLLRTAVPLCQSVAFPPVEKFHNLKQRKKSLISGAKLKTFEKHISNSILNMVIFENWFKMD